MQHQLTELKELTTAQYDACREAALKRVAGRIGEKPTRQAFQRELGSLWTPLDLLALVVFVAALAVSSVHIITHMSQLSEASYKATSAGLIVDSQTYAVVHQLSMIALAEASMLLFMTIHAMSAPKRAGRPAWQRWMSGTLLLAIIAAVFVFVANIQSGIGILESIMPPVFTIGLGLHFERLIVESMTRRADVTRRYLAALDVWEVSSKDHTKHPEYKPLLAQELWQKLVSLKPNAAHVDAPASFKAAAVRRELAKEAWAHELGADLPSVPSAPAVVAREVAVGVVPLVVTTPPAVAVNSNGNGHH